MTEKYTCPVCEAELDIDAELAELRDYYVAAEAQIAIMRGPYTVQYQAARDKLEKEIK